MKKLTKIVVLLLSVALVCTGVVIAVSASAATELDVTKAKGGTLVLNGDVKVSSTIEINEDLTIDLAGNSLTSTANVAFNVVGRVNFSIIGGGSITVDGGLVKADGASIKIAGGVDGIKLTQTDAINDEPIIYTGSGEHSYTNVDVVSYATSTDLFSIGGASDNTFAAFKLTAENGVLTDNSGKATSSVIAMRDGGVSLKISAATINAKGINAIKLADNQIRYDGFVIIDNASITTANGTAAGDSLSKPAFLAGDAVIASDIIVSNSSITYNNQPRIRGNSDGSAIIFKNTSICNLGSGDSFFNTVNVKLEDGSCLYGNPSDSDYVNKAPLFNLGADYKNPGSMTVGSYKKVNLIIGVGTRFDEATYNKIVNQTAVIGSSTYKYYNDGQIIFDNGMLPGDTISGEEDVVSYRIIKDAFGNSDAPYVVVLADQKEFYEGVVSYNQSTPNYTAWNMTGDTVGSTTVDGNTVFQYVKGAENATNIVSSTNSNFSDFKYDTWVFDIEIATPSSDLLPQFVISLCARASGAGSQIGLLNVNSNGTVSRGSESFTIVNSDVKLDLSGWNHLSIVLDKSKADAEAYVFINGEYVGKGSAYSSSTTSIMGLRLDINKNGTSVGDTLYLDDAVLRGYNQIVDGNPENIAENYLYGGGAVWNKTESTPSIEAGGASLTLAEALTLNRETGAIAKVNKDIISEEIITEGGYIFADGYNMIAPEGSMPYKKDESGLAEFSWEYDLSLDISFYTGEYQNEAQMNDPAYYQTFEDCDIGTIYTDLMPNPTLPATKGLYNRYYMQTSASGWSSDPDGQVPELSLTYDLAKAYKEANPGEALKIYPIYDYTKGSTVYQIIIIKADGTVDEARSLNMGSNDVIWNGNYSHMNMQYGETIVLQKDMRTQQNFGRAWQSATASSEKVINIDLNGHMLKIDQNAGQGSESGKVNQGIPAANGQTINVYSSREGGKIACYGGKSTYISGGCLFYIGGGAPVVNVGKFVTADGKEIPGSNLTLEASTIVDMTTSDNTAVVNIDGANIGVNAIDTAYAYVFKAMGTMNIKNCIIASPISGMNLFATYGTDESCTLNVDNCTIITAENGESLFGSLSGTETVTFTNCVTNGSFAVPSGATSTVVVGGGNVYSVSASALLDNDVSEKAWNRPTVFTNGKTEYTVTYFKVKENNNWSSTADDYDYFTYKIVIGGDAGTDVLNFPETLSYKAVGPDDMVTVTYNVAGGSPIVETYIKGDTFDAIPEISSVSLDVLTLVHSGEFDIELPQIIEENIVLTPIYEAEANLTGILANVASADSKFAINIYIPAAYSSYINAITAGNDEFAGENATVGGNDYIMATVYRQAYNANRNAEISITLTEDGYTAIETVEVNILRYVKEVIASEDASVTDEDKALVLYMLNYASEAMKYCGKEVDNSILEVLANAGISEYDYAGAAADAGMLAPIFKDVTFDISSKDLAYIFSINESFSGTFTVTLGNKTYTQDDIADGKLKIGGLGVYELALDLNIAASDADGNALVEDGKYNFATYICAYNDGAAGEAGEECLALTRALYNYAMNANEYRNPVDNTPATPENPSEE